MKEIFTAVLGRRKEDALPAKISYALFEVTDDAAAKRMLAWVRDDIAARRAVHEFVRKTFSTSVLGLDVPPYKIGGDGYLESVTFNGWFTPAGWNGIPYTNAQQPESPEAVAAVHSLLRVPSRHVLHDIIDWPTIDDTFASKEDKRLIKKINGLPEIVFDGEKTYVMLPVPSNFEAYTDVQNIIQDWQPPETLSYVSENHAVKPKIMP